MKKLLLILFVVLTISTNAFAIEGDYKIDGTSPDGSKYSGSVVISKSGSTYVINWLIAKTGEQYKGLGILTDGVLSVGWGSNPDVGVISYKVEDKKLTGTWASAPGVLGKETLIKQ